MIMKKILYLLFWLCLCFTNLFAQRHTVDEKVYIDDKVYPDCSNRDTYVPVLWEKTNLYYYIVKVTVGKEVLTEKVIVK